uniref:Transcriptional regulator domain-containing protein n=1 Tax=uncultured Thiotrichaceae bacterium TaxID=298394 RepID=A0A6S6UCB1_9GAMM|nr:MAG: Transcriptional regulator domain-containing protein [uncultured Thiotrichaceae bacterium]
MIPARANDALIQRRQSIDRQWQRFVSGRDNVRKQPVEEAISSSWKRCAPHLSVDNVVPADDDYEANHRWKESPLRLAARQEREKLSQLAKEGSLVAAIADPQGHLLWTYASQHMRKRAESVNFIAGGHWGERTAGTNAVGLSLAIRKPSTVFSSEHYLPFVHDWVCYASPIIHPQSGELLGVLDISTTWNQHTPLGQSAVCELARSIAGRLPEKQPQAELEIFALGSPKVVFRGKVQHVSQRQLEILCLLALNPQGLSLDAFHAALYGDAKVSPSTLKAELSHLRRMLDGQIGSRPYRLMVPVWGDFIQIWQALRLSNTDEALGLYRGAFLSQSVSPELVEWHHCVEAVMGKLMNSCDDFSVLLKTMCQGSVGSALVRERLAELIPDKISI